MATLENDQLDLFIQPVLDVYLEMEDELIRNIAKRLKIKDGEKVDDVLSWQIRKLADLQALGRENLITITKLSGKGLDALFAAMRDAGLISAGKYDKMLQAAYKNGADLTVPAAATADSHVLDVLAFYVARARTTMNLIHTTILTNAQQVYRDILSDSVARVLSGVDTPDGALYRTADKWAEKGIPALVDAKGRHWQVEPYVRMVARTTVHQTTAEMQFARMDSWGSDLIEVSSHMGARPRCAPYQGRIYSRSGMSEKYPAWSSTSYGEKAGLLGINCGHSVWPFVDGVSTQTYKPYPEKENAEAYEQSQRQRYLEREIRKWKRKADVRAALGATDDQVAAARAKVREKQKAMREFIKSTGRTRRYNREQIVV